MRFRKSGQLIKSICFLAAALVIALPSLSFADGNYQDHETKRLTLEREVEALEQEMKGLIHHQHQAHGNDEVKRIVDTLAATHKKYSKTLKDYEELRLHVRFKHPDEADQSERNYRRFTVKSLKELESEVGLDGRLDRIKQRVLATFPIPQLEKEKEPEPKVHPFFRKPASETGAEDESHERIKLVK